MTTLPFRATHVLRLHRSGARVSIPVLAHGSLQSVTPLFTYSEWSDSGVALWSFDPVRGLLYQGSPPGEHGWEHSELVPIATLTEGGLQ